MHPWKFSNVSVSITSCDSAWISSVVLKRRPFSRNFILGNRKKSQGARSGEWGGGGNHCNVFESQELLNEWCVSGRVVMVEKAVVFLPLVWTFAPNALPQPLQNLTVSKTCHWRCDQGVRTSYGQFLGCRKKDQQGLDTGANLTRFFRPLWVWRLPLRRLLLSLRVITIHPCFITGYDNWRWSWGRLWLVVWVPCIQKLSGPSGRRSAVLAQISQKCVSCSNCPPKCIERSRMTVLLSHKHRG
jgi:hypothetical protein